MTSMEEGKENLKRRKGSGNHQFDTDLRLACVGLLLMTCAGKHQPSLRPDIRDWNEGW